MATTPRRSTSITRDEMSKELKETIAIATDDLKEHVRTAIKSLSDTSDYQFKLLVEKIDGQRALANERQTTVDRRLDGLEENDKNQRWFSGIIGVIAALLGFGGGKVIH